MAPEAWAACAPNGKWTGRELFTHVTWAFEQLPREVAAALQGKGMFNYPKWIADPGSLWIIRWSARRATRETLTRRYQAATDAALASLESVRESDWDRGAKFTRGLLHRRGFVPRAGESRARASRKIPRFQLPVAPRPGDMDFGFRNDPEAHSLKKESRFADSIEQ